MMKTKKFFLPNLQTCIHNLLLNHLSSSQISKVIEEVLKMVGKKANHKKKHKYNSEHELAKVGIVPKQLGVTLVNERNISLYTDETSKFGNKMMGYHVRYQDGQYFTLGLRDITTKSGKDSLETFKEILHDTDNRINDTENETSE